MGYGTILSVLDVPWVIVFVIIAIAVGQKSHRTWISRSTLTAFLLFKIVLCVTFSTWAVTSDQDFDAAGYYVNGQQYADKFEELVKGESREYLRDTPFFGRDSISTDRMNSLTGLLMALSGRSFMACSLALCSLGAIGQLLIYKYLASRFPHANRIYLWPLLFVPSLSLWSGMLLKDTLGMFSLGLLIYYLDLFLHRKTPSSLLLLLLGVYVALEFRSFILVMISAFSLFMFWDRLIAPRMKRGAEGGFWGVIYVAVAVITSVAVLAYYADNYGEQLIEQQNATDASYSGIEGGSTFANAHLSMSAGGLFALPIGIANTLLRPYIWEVSKANQLVAALENLVILYYVFSGWRHYLFKIGSADRQSIRSIMYGSLMATLVCAAGVGLYASNLGTISRYRTPVLPIFLMGPCVAFGLAQKRRPQTWDSGQASGLLRDNIAKRLKA
jgi:hypothetical protein